MIFQNPDQIPERIKNQTFSQHCSEPFIQWKIKGSVNSFKIRRWGNSFNRKFESPREMSRRFTFEKDMPTEKVLDSQKKKNP